MSFKIPHILEAVANFLQTEEGKKAIVDYVIENNLWDEELVKEMKIYNQDQSQGAGGACEIA
jgi:hypothetical protein